MAKIKNLFFILLTVAFMSGMVAGCSSGPSPEQLKALEDLKAEVAELTKQLDTKKDQRDKLQKEIAAKDAKIKEFQNQTAEVKKRCP
jgi:septal ring factor EnvC (AmiA/AmiB activator)